MDVQQSQLNQSISREESWSYERRMLSYIQNAAAHGLYEIRGLGAKRRLPHFDDLVFLGASMSRYPLEGYREKCTTKTILSKRFHVLPWRWIVERTLAWIVRHRRLTIDYEARPATT